MSELLTEYCSWCNKLELHLLEKKNVFRRNTYKCRNCKNPTIQCRFCGNMAKTGNKWDDELCAEHDGSIASFKKLDLELADLTDYKNIFQRERPNLMHVAKIGAGIVAGGVVVVAPAAVLAGPVTAFLSGGSFAVIGGGSTAAVGAAIVTATGAALGGYQGAMVSNTYFGAVDHFDIRKLKPSENLNKHAIIVVNGFMSQGNADTSDWTNQLSSHFSSDTWYHTDWESKNLQNLGSLILMTPQATSMELAKELAKRAARSVSTKIGPMAWLSNFADLIANPWHASMVKASMTGIMLADAIARTPGWTFTLAGHSLGARVIYYALEALSTKNRQMIENVYLLGGAVGGGAKDSEGWEMATTAVKGKIFNCFSAKDEVLKYLYQCANGYASTPIGYKKIALEHPKIHNVGCDDLVSSHMEWKKRFSQILTQLRGA